MNRIDMSVTKRPSFNDYGKLAVLGLLVMAGLRVYETGSIMVHHDRSTWHLQSELIGLVHDLIITGTFLVMFLPLYLLLYKFKKLLADISFLILLNLLALAHILILKYFLYQLKPLDVFLFGYSYEEIIFTIRSSDTPVIQTLITTLVIPVATIIIYRYTMGKPMSKRWIVTVYGWIFLSIPLLPVLSSMDHTDSFSLNKPYYFYQRTLQHYTTSDDQPESSSQKDLTAFRTLQPDRHYIDESYPLLHEFEPDGSLRDLFSTFDTTPNIVILIVEGLNDDFINDYHGVTLMPFLHDLSSKSLYWDHCFTLGERSFAAVPSLIGSLPYGKIGFTLEDKLPRHLSLVSVLKSRGYYTSFFYGQASWFHLKNRFFQFNDIDLIFDKHNFTDKYEKIIVGADQFFFGYNDKDLFSQSLEVLDTLPTSPRLDIYFTGTSHSPFIIPEQDHYDDKYGKLIKALPSNADQSFFNTYRKNLKTVLFVDDALQEFFNAYSSRANYNNTIFIITGDHPMTEVPIANSLKRYHVPMIIYSPKLKQAQKFTHTVSHLDLYETVLSFLQPYIGTTPSVSAALGSNLMLQNPKSNAHYAFMNDNREIIDYYSNGYYIGGGQLFKVNNDLSIQEINDEDKMQQLHSELDVFKKVNHYVCSGNKIITDSLYCSALNHQLIYTNENRTDTAAFQSEYFELMPPIKMSNKGFTMDIGFDYENVSEQDVALVYQLTNKDDSIVFWNSTAFTADKTFLQGHYVIPAQAVQDSTLTFKTYIWNRTKRKCFLSDIDLLIHSSINQ